MLNLRKLPRSLRKHASRTFSSSRKTTGSHSPDASMAVLTSSVHVSQNAKDSVETTVTEVVRSDSESVRSEHHVESLTIVQPVGHLTRSTRVTRVYEDAYKLRARMICEIEELDDTFFTHVNLETYLAYIADERLMNMPKRGSSWDRVLREAEYFGLQIDEFSSSVKDLIDEGVAVRDTALGACYALLELGCEQAEALEPTFTVLFEVGHLLGHLLRLQDLLTLNEATTHDLGELFGSLLSFIAHLAIEYRQTINRLSRNAAAIDFDEKFGHLVNDILAKKAILFEHMWSYALPGDNVSASLDTLYHQLGASRDGGKSLLYGRAASKKERVHGTCAWIERDLIDFLESDKSVLSITAEAGYGKSMLAAWVRERLERSIGHVRQERPKFETLSFTFESDHAVESIILAFLKSILAQLLDLSIGDSKLFKKLQDALNTFVASPDNQSLIHDLWAALEIGLATVNKRAVPIVIIVDGLDEINGRETKESAFYQKLCQIAKKHSSTALISFSRPSSFITQKGDCTHLSVTSDHIRDDVRTYLLEHMCTTKAWESLEHGKQTDILRLLSNQTKEPFLAAYLTSRLVKAGLELDVLQKNLKSGSFNPLKEFFKRINLKDLNTQKVLAFMVVAKRPLSIGEMTNLLSVDTTRRTIISHIDIQKLIDHTLGLVTLRSGKLRFKHSVIRSYLVELCGKSLMSVKDAHRQLVSSMLLFAKLQLTKPFEVTMDGTGSKFAHEMIHSHPIIDYVVRYWTHHVRQSSLVGNQGELALSQEFKEIFPGSNILPALEWVYWSKHSTSMAEIIEMHEWTLSVRSACFGEKHQSVLQTLIILGTLHRGQSNLTKACEYFYRASNIGQAILFKFSPVVISCTNLFLVCTETIAFTERTLNVTHREEMIRFMITVCKAQHGLHSDSVIRWCKTLAKLYVDIHEEHLAVSTYKELREIFVIRFGPHYTGLKDLDGDLTGLNIVLKKRDGRGEGIVEVEDLFFESVESREYTDEVRVTILLRLAKVYESEGKYFFAERLYISLWRCISEACQLKPSLELRLLQAHIAFEYVHFLRRFKRNEEACNILICIWAEYENQDLEELAIVIRLKELATLFRSFGLLATSVSVLKRVWLWFKEKNLTEHKDASSTTVTITEVVEEITETITQTTTTTTVLETLTRDIFETSYSRCKEGEKADHHFFKACVSLVNLYLKLEQWSEAEVVTRKSLELVWKDVFSVDGKIVLEGGFVTERILVASNLALCYLRQRQFEKAEQLYLQIWRACFSLHAEDDSLLNTTTTLILFYEEYHRHEKVIDVYTEVLKHYREHLGTSHKLAIQTLYKLAAAYTLLGKKEAYACYIEIMAIYSTGKRCHHDGFEAATVLLHYYFEQKRWVELEKLCVLLWETISHNHEWKYSEEFVQLIWQRYRHVLEFHLKVAFSVLHKLTVQYSELVTKLFRHPSTIAIEAMLSLAEICEGHEDHYHESITVYEEVITKMRTVEIVNETKIHTVKKRLSKLYVTVVTKGKTTETTILARAIALCLETYEHLKSELGWAHQTTLFKLRDLVLLYNVLGDKHRGMILSLLQSSVVYIVANVKVPRTLFDAATTLAGIYSAAGFQLQGKELLQQLRYLILFPGFDATDHKITIELAVPVTKVALVFLIAFDQGLAANTKDIGLSFSHLMGDLLMEMLLYEQYVSVIANMTETTSVEVVLEHAARLRCIWDARGRKSFVDVLDKNLFAIFTSRYTKQLGSHAGDKHVFDLYVSILCQIGDGPFADRATIDFAQLTCKAINSTVYNMLVDKKDLIGAHAVAKCGFQFANSQRFYHRRNCLVYGYRLADLLAGHGVTTWTSADPKQKEALLGTSKEVLQIVLGVMKEGGIDLLSLRFEDLSKLIHLLGEQKSYQKLQELLISLWNSREVQRNWSPDTVLRIGSLLVEAHVGASHIDRAIELCDTLFYNLRQSRGGTDPQTLYFADRLTTLLRSVGRLSQAVRVHEDVLHDLDEHYESGARSGTDRQGDLRSAADRHLDGVWICGWDPQNGSAPMSRPRSYLDIYARLGKFGKLNTPSPEQWATVKKTNREENKTDLTMISTTEWVLTVLDDGKDVKKRRKRDSIQPAKERWGSSWGKKSLEAAIVC